MSVPLVWIRDHHTELPTASYGPGESSSDATHEGTEAGHVTRGGGEYHISLDNLPAETSTHVAAPRVQLTLLGDRQAVQRSRRHALDEQVQLDEVVHWRGQQRH